MVLQIWFERALNQATAISFRKCRNSSLQKYSSIQQQTNNHFTFIVHYKTFE
jgi:hypothetical protein